MKTIIALIKKEFLQIIRDPSTIIIAFILPFISILIYRYGLNLDSVRVCIGIKNDAVCPETESLMAEFNHNPYVKTIIFNNEQDLQKAMDCSLIQGACIIPNDFAKQFYKNSADLLIITDGSEANTAHYVQNYIQQIVTQWTQTHFFSKNTPSNLSTRYWYNPTLNSHYFILPGSLAITMTLIGILLTALVIAREWERGTMEALLSTPVTRIHIVLGKYVPYFILGMSSFIVNLCLCVTFFKIPFHGSYFVIILMSGLFLITLLGIGLLISTKLKTQFLASQVAVGIGFLPALFLSGLLFPIHSMPLVFQYLTHLLPQRYYVAFVESEFMVGTVWQIVIPSVVFLSLLGSILFVCVYKHTHLRIDQ